jgi:hypothetical protein|tara:strand:+ start:4580 stop:4753 length:174 start_codon:yes stop_codon:yes gene_type:complete
MATPATFLRMDENEDAVRSEHGMRKINAVNIHAALDRSLGELTNQPILLFERLRGGE